MGQLNDLNATLQREIQTRDQQIAALQDSFHCNGEPAAAEDCTDQPTRFNATSATQIVKLEASDGTAGDSFGYTVASSIDGMVVTGSSYQDAIESDAGAVYVFEKNSTGLYEQVSKLVASDGAAGDNFGWTVAAASGTTPS
jgi:hypothetical protein